MSLHEEMKDGCLLALADPGEVPNSDSTDQDHFYTTIKSARDVTFQTRQGTPGLKVRTGCTSSSVSWIPVVPTPVAARTRARSRVVMLVT